MKYLYAVLVGTFKYGIIKAEIFICGFGRGF
jgi:hypothetical protein